MVRLRGEAAAASQRRSFSIPEREQSRDEYLRLIQTARASGNERLALVMETICATGIRVGEVGYITVEAARAGRTEIYLKGKIRTILIPRKLCGKLLRYARRQRTGSGKIFPDEAAKPAEPRPDLVGDEKAVRGGRRYGEQGIPPIICGICLPGRTIPSTKIS